MQIMLLKSLQSCAKNAYISGTFFSAVNFFSAEHIPNRGLKGIHHISQKAKMNFSQANFFKYLFFQYYFTLCKECS